MSIGDHFYSYAVISIKCNVFTLGLGEVKLGME